MTRPAGGGATRFNGQPYVDAYRDHRQYPRIHDALFEVAVAELGPGPTLDLASSTGLLGRRYRDATGEPVYAAERDQDAILRGTEAGIYGEDLPVLHLDLTPSSVQSLLDWMSNRGIVNVLARRCLCVISEALPLDLLRDGWDQVGVKAVVLEGQTQSSRSVHPVGHADQQAAALAPTFVVRPPNRGHVRYLTRA